MTRDYFLFQFSINKLHSLTAFGIPQAQSMGCVKLVGEKVVCMKGVYKLVGRKVGLYIEAGADKRSFV